MLLIGAPGIAASELSVPFWEIVMFPYWPPTAQNAVVGHEIAGFIPIAGSTSAGVDQVDVAEALEATTSHSTTATTIAPARRAAVITTPVAPLSLTR
jgi:hypothetical protein